MPPASPTEPKVRVAVVRHPLGGRRSSSAFVTLTFVLVTFFLLILYLSQITQAATQGFRIRELDIHLSEVAERNETLLRAYTEVSKLSQLEVEAARMGLVPITKPDGVVKLSDTVAAR
ncbi:MAG: hypothetical protein HY459_02675 [Parcubacteria group bacterium]|nr:hypothetical protein [Parcubacteria group bacterium]